MKDLYYNKILVSQDVLLENILILESVLIVMLAVEIAQLILRIVLLAKMETS